MLIEDDRVKNSRKRLSEIPSGDVVIWDEDFYMVANGVLIDIEDGHHEEPCFHEFAEHIPNAKLVIE